MSDIFLYNANIADVVPHKKDITRLILDAYLSSFPANIIHQDFIDTKFNDLLKYLANQQCTLLLAKSKQSILALCHYFIKNDFEGVRGHLNIISVSPAFQGFKYVNVSKTGGGGIMLNNAQNSKTPTTSIAKELIHMMESQLLAKGIVSIDLFVSSHNLQALHFYRKLDFFEQRKLMIKNLSTNNNKGLR